jgi:hypothetical protein
MWDNKMIYSRSLANDFWYEFDNTFLWFIEEEVDDAMGKAGDIETLYTEHRQKGTYPNDYISEVKDNTDRADSIIFLTEKQFGIITKYFENNLQNQQRAFEDFGQGVLYDERPPRPKDRRIHMMDENHRGYRSWYIFNRTTVLLDATNNTKIIHQICQYIGLASAIHSEQHPNQSDSAGRNPNNPEIDEDILKHLRNTWLSQTFEQLDTSFDNNLLLSKWRRNRMKKGGIEGSSSGC